MRRSCLIFNAVCCAVRLARCAEPLSPPPQTQQDIQREAAAAEFTRTMKQANYPALFDAAAKEFNVPSDVLKGIAFAETRWEHLTWPPGDTASPETGMPRPYGIMSLWDNDFLGHSLIDAAALIGKEPDELKRDPLQNIRGAAALLKKLYDETPKPSDTTEADVESWRYAIRKYSGIPQPELNAQHALDIYVFMSRGFHQFGIEWNARPVKLEPIREETRRIVAEEQAKREALAAANSKAMQSRLNAAAGGLTMGPNSSGLPQTRLPAKSTAPPISITESPQPAKGRPAFWALALCVALFALGGYLLSRRRTK